MIDNEFNLKDVRLWNAIQDLYESKEEETEQEKSENISLIQSILMENYERI